MRKLFSIFLLSLLSCYGLAQDSNLVSRIVFIGDAGEIDPQQSDVISHAAGQVLQGKTTVVYLGDNIYPKGMGLPGSAEEAKTKDILRSQFVPMRAAGAKVYFLPGNHDWDKSGPEGLAKIKTQGAFLREQQDADLRMVPADGCPGPVLLPISANLSIVAFDSEWWLHKYHKANEAENCSTDKEAVISKMKALAEQHKDQIILLAAHHPFQTYGAHSGRFSLMQHLFPLRDVNKILYLPLPIIGSLYPLIRGTIPNRQDVHSKTYRAMINSVDAAFAGVPNLVHVAGHDHGLQFIKKQNNIQVVSGAGTKTSQVLRGKYAQYGKAIQGYVVADLHSDKSITFKFYEEQDAGIVETFRFVKHYTAPQD